MRKIVLFLGLIIPVSYADKVQPKVRNESVNYCRDAEKAKSMDDLLAKFPNDLAIIKMYALRIGLCKAVDDKKISLDKAIDVFNAEHMKVWKETFEQEQRDKNKKKSTI